MVHGNLKSGLWSLELEVLKLDEVPSSMELELFSLEVLEVEVEPVNFQVDDEICIDKLTTVSRQHNKQVAATRLRLAPHTDTSSTTFALDLQRVS